MNTVVPAPAKTVVLDTHTCGKCGIVFAMPRDYVEKRKEDRATWYCPNGCPRAFIGPTELTKARDELARTKAQLDQERAYAVSLSGALTREAEASAKKSRQINGYKGIVARTKRRVAKGRCPCCSHQFKDLKQHMATEHPHWDPDKGAEAMAK